MPRAGCLKFAAACPIESLPKLMTKGSIAKRPLTAKRLVSLRAARVRVGGRICVLQGAFEGTEGVVCFVKQGPRYVLALDGLPPGVYIAVEEDAIIALPG